MSVPAVSSSSSTAVPIVAARAAQWMWNHRAWIGAGVTAAIAAKYLIAQAAAGHTQAQRPAGEEKAAAVVAAKGTSMCPSVSLKVDKTLFPARIPSASVPGLQLYTRAWRVASPRAVVFVLHGYGEHIGRYEALAATLNSIGCSVYGLDHLGHGQSGGDRAYVERLHHYVEDALSFIEHVQQGDEFKQNKSKPPAFLFGHSMGGLLATLVMQASYTPDVAASAAAPVTSPVSAVPSAVPQFPLAELQQRWRGRLWPWRGCVLSAPALAPHPKDAQPALQPIALFLSRHFPKLQLTGLETSGISRSPAVVAHYRADQLNWHGRMRARWAVEMMSGMECVQNQLAQGQIRFPMLIIQGTVDRLVDPRAPPLLHAGSRAQDKTLREWEGGYHELLNDAITQQEAAQQIREWIDKRIAQ